MIDKKQLTEILYLSCVENYYLAWLKEHYDIRNLYGNQFISLKQVFYDFKFGANYESYYQVSRLQDIAEYSGITKHNYFNCQLKEAFNIIQSQNNDSLCLIKVNEKFFKTFKRFAWRADHYICVDAYLEWINQYPLSSGSFTLKQLEDCYGGCLCIYRLGDLSVEMIDNVSEALIREDFDIKDIPVTLKDLHSAIGILRITRKRLKDYYHNNKKIQSLFTYLVDYLDKLYFQIKVMELRGLGSKKISDLVSPIIDYERQISKELKNEEINKT